MAVDASDDAVCAGALEHQSEVAGELHTLLHARRDARRASDLHFTGDVSNLLAVVARADLADRGAAGAADVVVVAVQVGSGAGDAFLIGRLGPEALAGVALVFPLWMLMVTTANGAVGGSISSAIARALGGGRDEETGVVALQHRADRRARSAVGVWGWTGSGRSTRHRCTARPG